MADITNGSIWSLDTSATGIVSGGPIAIKSINVTWKVASAGEIQLNELPGQTPGRIILHAKSLGAASAATDQLSQQFLFGGIVVNGLQKVTMTDIGDCQIVVK